MRGQELHLPDEVYETSLCALVEFPALKWWSRWVARPHQPACKAGALLVCHDPMKLAGCLRAARSGLSFGDSVAQAGARPVRIEWSMDRPGGGRLKGPKLKGPEAIALPAHAISIKNKHLLVIYSIPARGFTAAVSVFRGTPPPKPSICKSVSIRLGARNRSAWAHHAGGMPRHSCALIRLALSDIIETSLCYRSQTVHLSLPPFHRQFQGNKKPCLHEVSRV